MHNTTISNNTSTYGIAIYTLQVHTGSGEPAIICMGGVLANAVFDACGARSYQLPMTPERVLESLAKVK